MANRTTPEDLADDVGKIVTVWKAHPEFILNDVTLKQVEDTVSATLESRAQSRFRG